MWMLNHCRVIAIEMMLSSDYKVDIFVNKEKILRYKYLVYLPWTNASLERLRLSSVWRRLSERHL